MKKRIMALFLLACMLLTLLPVGALAEEALAGENTGEENHTHTWGAWRDTGNGQHTRKCTGCDETQTAAHNYVYTSDGAGKHTGKCQDCGATLPPEDCSGGTATCKEKAKCDKCHASYGELSAEHKYVWKSNGNGTHNEVCEVCDKVRTENEACSGGAATCKEPAKCEKCGASYGAVNADAHKQAAQPRHVAGTETHEYYCELCNKTLGTEACTKTEATCAEPAKCTKCGEHMGKLPLPIPAAQFTRTTAMAPTSRCAIPAESPGPTQRQKPTRKRSVRWRAPRPMSVTAKPAAQ